MNAPVPFPISGSSGSSGSSGFAASGVWLPLGEAARRLGVTPDAIRKRIPAGTARARKRGGRWLVWVEATGLEPSDKPGEPEGTEDAEPEQPEGSTIGTGATGTPVPPGTFPAPAIQKSNETELRLLVLVEKLQEENRNLAGQLGFREAQLQQAHERIRLLEAGPGPTASPSPGEEPDRPEQPDRPDRPESGERERTARPWWRFW
jgi:hypothetical protein